MKSTSFLRLLVLSFGVIVALLSFLTAQAQSTQPIGGRIAQVSQTPLIGVAIMVTTGKQTVLEMAIAK